MTTPSGDIPAQAPDRDEADQPDRLSASNLAAESVRIEEERRAASKPERSVLGSALVISGATFLSRLLGLGRTILMASLFGFSREMDAFFLAFTIPNLFRKLFGEGALSSAAVPVLQSYRLRGEIAGNQDATRRLLSSLASILALALGGFSILAIGASWLVPGEWFGDASKYSLFRQYLAVLLPYVIFICVAALQSGALNCFGRFGLPALMPAVANLAWIALLGGIHFSGVARTNPHQAVLWMCAGVLGTGVLQWALQLPALARVKLLAPPRLTLHEHGLRDIFRAMGPMLFALAVFQINTFLDQVLAEVLVEGNGAVSAYSYASRLFQFPLGLVSVALSTAMFPLMSKLAHEGELEKLTAAVVNSLKLLAFLSLPAAAGMMAIAWPLTELLLGGQASTREMLERTALVVALLGLSLPLVSAISVLTKAFYALRDNRTPTRIALAAVVVNLVANVLLLQTPLREAGLALGTAISGLVNLAALGMLLRRRLRGTVLDSLRAKALPPVSERLVQPLTPSRVRGVPISFLRSALLSAVMAFGAYAVEHALYGAFGLQGRTSRVLSVLAAVASGVVIYAGLALAIRAPEATQFLGLRKRRGKAAEKPAQ